MTKTINNEIYKILNSKKWNEKSPRGLNTSYIKNYQFSINPLYPILDSSIRKFNWKYFAGELRWFLCANSKNYIYGIEQYSSFWKNIVNNKNEVNSNYGQRLLWTLNKGKSQLGIVYETLLNDKFSRQAIAFISGKEFQIPTKDYPCTIYINFSINDNKLDMLVKMRSNDIIFGLSYDAPWFSLVHQNMYLLLKEKYPEISLGLYTHSADDFHWYIDRHKNEINSFKDKNVSNYKFELKKPLFFFDEFYKTKLTSEGEKLKSIIYYDESLKFKDYLEKLSNFIIISK